MSYSLSFAVDKDKRTIRANQGEPVQFTDHEIVKAKLAESDLIIYETKEGLKFARGFFLNGDVITLATEIQI